MTDDVSMPPLSPRAMEDAAAQRRHDARDRAEVRAAQRRKDARDLAEARKVLGYTEGGLEYEALVDIAKNTAFASNLNDLDKNVLPWPSKDEGGATDGGQLPALTMISTKMDGQYALWDGKGTLWHRYRKGSAQGLTTFNDHEGKTHYDNLIAVLKDYASGIVLEGEVCNRLTLSDPRHRSLSWDKPVAFWAFDAPCSKENAHARIMAVDKLAWVGDCAYDEKLDPEDESGVEPLFNVVPWGFVNTREELDFELNLLTKHGEFAKETYNGEEGLVVRKADALYQCRDAPGLKGGRSDVMFKYKRRDDMEVLYQGKVAGKKSHKFCIPTGEEFSLNETNAMRSLLAKGLEANKSIVRISFEGWTTPTEGRGVPTDKARPEDIHHPAEEEGRDWQWFKDNWPHPQDQQGADQADQQDGGDQPPAGQPPAEQEGRGGKRKRLERAGEGNVKRAKGRAQGLRRSPRRPV